MPPSAVVGAAVAAFFTGVVRAPPEKLRRVGSTLVPHYDEDQEGDQEDAAERKRLPDAELIARLRG